MISPYLETLARDVMSKILTSQCDMRTQMHAKCSYTDCFPSAWTDERSILKSSSPREDDFPDNHFM